MDKFYNSLSSEEQVIYKLKGKALYIRDRFNSMIDALDAVAISQIKTLELCERMDKAISQFNTRMHNEL